MRIFAFRGLVLGAAALACGGGCPGKGAAPGNNPPPGVLPTAAAPALPPPPTVSCRPDPARPVAIEKGRKVHCAIDVGSRNVKLVVASVQGEQPATLQTERQCRLRLQLADKTFDPKTRAPRPLGSSDQAALVDLFQSYRRQCEADGGTLHGAVATEWARRAPNGEAVKQALAEQTGVPFEILDRAAEARYGYLAATRGARGKLVLDFGSRSLQLSFWAQGEPAPEGLSVPLGIDEAGDRYFGTRGVRSYAEGRRALEPMLRAALAPALTRAKAALAAGRLAPELYSLGENGDLALALGGQLWSGTPPRAVGEAGYSAAVKAHVGATDPRHGKVTAVLTTAQVGALERLLEGNLPLFQELRDPALRRVYGNKMLVYPVIARLLEQDLAVTTLVLVPQEMADGYLIEHLAPAAKP